MPAENEAGPAHLDQLERRVTALEQRLYRGRNSDETVSVLQKILTTHANVVHLKAESEAVSQMWEKRESLKKLGSIELHDETQMPVDAMAQIVLAGEGLLTDMAEKLTELTKLEEFTNTKVHQELPSLESKLTPLVSGSGAVRESFEAVSARTTQLLTMYTDIMTMLSKKCVYWDQLLTAAEGAAEGATAALD